jgi:hypothetical protein
VTLTREWTSYRRLRAPQANGAHLVDPPLAEIDDALAGNRAALAVDYDVQGRSLAELRSDARRELLAAAQGYVERYTAIARNEIAEDAPIILTGHQPQLFHAGVWFKNFVADRIAREHGGAAIHVIIDADLCGAPAIRVPCGSIESPQWQAIEFDAPAENMPAEERTLIDRERFASFGRRVETALAPLVRDPLITAFWPLVLERSRTTQHIGQCFAQARHLVERQWGTETLEIPQSTTCRFDAFGWLTAHLLANLPRLWRIHNDALARYRASHRIRTSAQPVPDLRREGDWLEAPYWIWNVSDPIRRPLWVRESGTKLVISNRLDSGYELPLAVDADGGAAVEKLKALETRGIKIRPRALVNTLYCRLLLSDLFIHGIGGAKYDQLTDEIIAEFFGFAPLKFAVATGTLRLPVRRPRVSPEDANGLEQELRQMTYHPESFIPAASRALPDIARWIDQKHTWVAAQPTPANARKRYLAIRAANAALQPAVAEPRAALQSRQSQVAAALRADAVLGSREWSFCLHPEQTLRRFLAIDS